MDEQCDGVFVPNLSIFFYCSTHIPESFLYKYERVICTGFLSRAMRTNNIAQASIVNKYLYTQSTITFILIPGRLKSDIPFNYVNIMHGWKIGSIKT